MNDGADPTRTGFEPSVGNLFGIGSATVGPQIDEQDAIAEDRGTWSPFGGSADLPERNLFGSDSGIEADSVHDAPASTVAAELTDEWDDMDLSVGAAALPSWAEEPQPRSVRAPRSRPTGTRRRASRVLAVGAGLLAVIACLVIVASDLGGGAGEHRSAVTRVAHRNTTAISRPPASVRPATPAANLPKRLGPSTEAHPRATRPRPRRRHHPRVVSHHRIGKHSRTAPTPHPLNGRDEPVQSAPAPTVAPQQPVVVAPQAAPAPSQSAPASRTAPTTHPQEFDFEQ